MEHQLYSQILEKLTAGEKDLDLNKNYSELTEDLGRAWKGHRMVVSKYQQGQDLLSKR